MKLNKMKLYHPWAIGDVHGCAEEFHELCTNIRKEDSMATIIQLGDLIDRGPYLKEVFDVCKEFNVIRVIGNHEISFIREHLEGITSRSAHRRATFEKFYASADQDVILDAMVKSHSHVVVDNVLLAHSIPTRYALIDYPYASDTLFTIGQDTGTAEIDDIMAEHDIHTVVHGHQSWNYSPLTDLQDKTAINIDGGCVYGGELVAIELWNRRTISVKAKQVYCLRGQN